MSWKITDLVRTLPYSRTIRPPTRLHRVSSRRSPCTPYRELCICCYADGRYISDQEGYTSILHVYVYRYLLFKLSQATHGLVLQVSLHHTELYNHADAGKSWLNICRNYLTLLCSVGPFTRRPGCTWSRLADLPTHRTES